jgi:antitoxin component YwqK of YwqJK toxin-antitoxin module
MKVHMEKINYDKLHRGNGSDISLYKRGESTPYTGKATSWYKNGQVKFEGMYKNGTLHGKATWWLRNGQKEYEATYINGKISKILTPALIPKINK